MKQAVWEYRRENRQQEREQTHTAYKGKMLCPSHVCMPFTYVQDQETKLGHSIHLIFTGQYLQVQNKGHTRMLRAHMDLQLVLKQGENTYYYRRHRAKC